MKPTGTLISIGGNEQKQFTKRDEKFHPHFGEGFILQDIINHSGGSDSRIEVITSASAIPEVVGEKYRETFKILGAENLGILDIRDQEMANDPHTLKRIESADAVLFSGGDQSQISRFIKDTQTHELLNHRYLNEKFVIAGTSAGAAVMSDDMIAGGRNGTVLKKNDLKWGKGLGFMKQAIFDSHFIRRGRFGRLAEAVALHSDKIGIGLGEDTGIIITEGNICEIIGSGMVVLFDGSNLNSNKYQKLRDDVPLSMANLTVHVLATKDKYFIAEKRAEIHYDERHHVEKAMQF